MINPGDDLGGDSMGPWWVLALIAAVMIGAICLLVATVKNCGCMPL